MQVLLRKLRDEKFQGVLELRTKILGNVKVRWAEDEDNRYFIYDNGGIYFLPKKEEQKNPHMYCYKCDSDVIIKQEMNSQYPMAKMIFAPHCPVCEKENQENQFHLFPKHSKTGQSAFIF